MCTLIPSFSHSAMNISSIVLGFFIAVPPSG